MAVEKINTLADMATMTDEDIASMGEESAKQLLMDLRSTRSLHGLNMITNETIARMGIEDVKQKLMDAKCVAQRC